MTKQKEAPKGAPTAHTSTWSYLSEAGAPIVIIGFMTFSVLLFYLMPNPTISSLSIYSSFFFLQLFLSYIIPGQYSKGLVLADGTQEVYLCNGLRCYLITIAIFFLGGFLKLWNLGLAYDNLLPLVSTSNYFAWASWLYIYIKGLSSPKREPTEGVLNDIWYGIELNPKMFGSDCTLFFDGRVSLIGVVMVGLSYACKQYELAGYISTPMLLFTAFFSIYMFDFFWFEDHFITTFDVAYEKFGWMLTWGDTVWMPFFCNLTGYFLVEDYRYEQPKWQIALIVIIWVSGYIFARIANAQKDAFKRDPSKKTFFYGLIKQDYISADEGKKVLSSGLWSLSRHPNYFGELANSLAMCLPGGITHSIFSFGYTIFIWALLITRFERDDRKCNNKYKQAWKEYSRRTPYKIVPYLY
ncbi:delta-14-sterol reductase [Acrasis kona]|uniref:Delta-14-sterol reductase n=2 Tax=Acrasis kona TaxID=1008807 RepID=A0AAW2YI36_9EUKA